MQLLFLEHSNDWRATMADRSGPMNWINLARGFEQLSSSNLNAYRYDPDSQYLWIEFHGNRVYRYDGVPQNVADGLGSAGSPGGYFHSAIKGMYSYNKE